MAEPQIFDFPNASGTNTVDCLRSTRVSGSMTVNTPGAVILNFVNVDIGTYLLVTFGNTSGSSVNLKVTSDLYLCRGVVGISTPVDLTVAGVNVPNNQALVAIGNACTINGVPYLVFNA